MTKNERQLRVLARGEHSNHSHVICGENIEIKEINGKKIIKVNENSNASLKHLLEKEFVETGQEIWTEEHKDIPLEAGEYEFIQQSEYNPLNEKIQQVKD